MKRQTAEHPPLNRERGFTLIETATVLFVIGLLLAGIIKGQALIDSTRAKRMVDELRTLSTAIYGYQSRFRALPGDDGLAADHLQGALNGNGNGQIEGSWIDSDPHSEAVRFWQHLRKADLLAGPDELDDSSPPPNNFLPTHVLGGRIGIQGGNHPPHPALHGQWIVCADGIPGDMAQTIGRSINNGPQQPDSMIIGIADPATGRVTAAESISDNERYTVCLAT